MGRRSGIDQFNEVFRIKQEKLSMTDALMVGCQLNLEKCLGHPRESVDGEKRMMMCHATSSSMCHAMSTSTYRATSPKLTPQDGMSCHVSIFHVGQQKRLMFDGQVGHWQNQ
jgi:hypothetical protein